MYVYIFFKTKKHIKHDFHQQFLSSAEELLQANGSNGHSTDDPLFNADPWAAGAGSASGGRRPKGSEDNWSQAGLEFPKRLLVDPLYLLCLTHCSSLLHIAPFSFPWQSSAIKCWRSDLFQPRSFGTLSFEMLIRFTWKKTSTTCRWFTYWKYSKLMNIDFTIDIYYS